MSEQQANTVSATVYTPAGTRVIMTFGLVTAAEVDAKIAELGFLVTAPGIEPGEVTEPILYVCRLDHFDTKENRDVPHIAFYSESEWLTKRWLHKYLDKPEDVEAFEVATGLTVAEMPVWGGEIHPERNSPKAIQQGAMIRLAKPIRIARETYTNKEGEPRHKLKRYVDTIGLAPKPQPMATGSSGQPSTQDTDKPTDDMLTEYTKHMYEHPKHQTASLESLRKNGSLTADMKPFVAACHVLIHRAEVDLFMTPLDVTAALDGALKEYLAQDGHNLITAWEQIIQWARVNKTKPKQQVS